MSIKHNEKVEAPMQKAVTQLKMSQQVLYSDSKLALKLMCKAQDEISQAHNVLAKQLGYLMKT